LVPGIGWSSRISILRSDISRRSFSAATHALRYEKSDVLVSPRYYFGQLRQDGKSCLRPRLKRYNCLSLAPKHRLVFEPRSSQARAPQAMCRCNPTNRTPLSILI
jgi:hypothetical protein